MFAGDLYDVPGGCWRRDGLTGASGPGEYREYCSSGVEQILYCDCFAGFFWGDDIQMTLSALLIAQIRFTIVVPDTTSPKVRCRGLPGTLVMVNKSWKWTAARVASTDRWVIQIRKRTVTG